MKISRLSFAVLLVVGLLLQMMSLAAAQQAAKPATAEQIKRGEHLVIMGGCNDCHSPKVFTAQGPMPDTSRLLSGAPANAKVPEIPVGVLAPDQWGALASNDFTSWAGPWGISFTANLTPDNVTGSGAWTEASFIKAIRTGKHLGAGRNILPPMPWQEINQAKESELKDIFAYLKSLKPIQNQVPAPVPPATK